MQANQKISKDKGVRQRNLSGALFVIPDFQEVCMGRKFDDLSLEEKIAHFDDVAARALPLWGYPEDADKKLLNFTENATYLVKAAGKETMIMRVHRLDYATMNSIRTELCWLTDLKRDTDISLASPIPMENGELVATIETPVLEEKRHVVCFSFAKGKAPVDSSDGNGDVGDLIARIEKIPDSITIPTFRVASVLTDFIGGMKSSSALTDEDRAMYRMVGEIMAKIHRQSRQWKRPDYFERMEWGFDGTFGAWNNFYGATYADPKWLSQKDIGVLDQAKELIRRRLALYGERPDRYGMIHSDLRTANLLKDGDAITVLDFDDCGMGWYMYDVAGAVALMEHRADLQDIVEEILKGYEAIRPLSEEDKEEIPTFIMMRRIGMLQSLLFRIGCVVGGSGEAAELTPEILAFYAEGTVILARRYLEEMGGPELGFTGRASVAVQTKQQMKHSLKKPYVI